MEKMLFILADENNSLQSILTSPLPLPLRNLGMERPWVHRFGAPVVHQRRGFCLLGQGKLLPPQVLPKI